MVFGIDEQWRKGVFWVCSGLVLLNCLFSQLIKPLMPLMKASIPLMKKRNPRSAEDVAAGKHER
jgi:hypothetical protein